MRRAIDYAIFPLFLGGAMVATNALLGAGVPPLLVTPIVVGPLTALAALLERARPERATHRPLDRPLFQEIGHFVVGLELGYGVALAACELVVRVTGTIARWPSSWPMALQLLFALVLYEAGSYWQHRAYHRVPLLWRFHALHHSGERLNVVRSVRFHAVDFATAAFTAYLPLTLLAAPDRLYTFLGVLLSGLGTLQHANIRMRTPAWLDAVVCTPGIHRHHHSRVFAESDRNFGNTVMIFDRLFGTFARGRAEGPGAIGLDDDPVPRAFLGQLLGPFRR